MSNELTISDIADTRAYERERPDFRSHVIALKKQRRIHVGEIITMIFENRDTMRFQIQEMARVEKFSSDEKIEDELKIYNELIPTRNELKATLLIELVNDEELREWLPKLPGIQNHIHLLFGEMKVTAYEPNEERLSKEDEITTTVHYMNFPFTDEQRDAFLEVQEGASISIDHPHYVRSVKLSVETIKQLQGDLEG
jgi:IS1 family transposase